VPRRKGNRVGEDQIDPDEKVVDSLRTLLLGLASDGTQARSSAATIDRFVSAIVEAELDYRAAADWVTAEIATRRPPTWRRILARVARDPSRYAAIVNNRSAIRALQYGASVAGYLGRPHWLRYLRDNPEDMRRAIAAALDREGVLFGEQGRPSERHRIAFVLALAAVFEELVGRPLGRSVASKTKERHGGEPSGPGLAFVRTCLVRLEPGVTDEMIAYLIRQAAKPDRSSARIENLDDT
jgi:hypothetical protein